jgi:hypothetical protein
LSLHNGAGEATVKLHSFISALSSGTIGLSMAIKNYTSDKPLEVVRMNKNDRRLFLEQNGFEARPGEGSRCYSYLVIDHNRNSERLFFANLDQAYVII